MSTSSKPDDFSAPGEEQPAESSRLEAGVQPAGLTAYSALFLRKFAELSLMAAILAVPFAYHFQFDLDLSERIKSFAEEQLPHSFVRDQLMPYLIGYMPVLEMKFSAWMVMGAMMAGGMAACSLMAALTGREEFMGGRQGAEQNWYRQRRTLVHSLIAAFLGFSLASILLWPPEIPPDAGQFAQGNSQGFGGGGFFFSTTAWLQVVAAFIFYLLCWRLFQKRALAVKLLGLMVIAGVVNAAVVILQKIEFGPLMRVWFEFPETETRNNLGAFIGHNTGLSSFLMTPALISVTWLFSVQPRKKTILRTFIFAGLFLIALALILAQSRAVIPIVGLCGLGLLAVLYRKACLMKGSRLFIILPVALFFALVTQFVPSKYNPLYREDVTMTERLTEFTAERLLTETRLRILVVSFSQLVSDSPIAGHGFGAFQYIYPEAQGQYFRDHPDSILAPTPFRTMRAHNEYLQTLIETGVIGLSLIVTAIVLLLATGWRTVNRTLMPHHIAIQTGVFFSILAILAHCFFDFPLRVPPVALYLIVLLAMWTAGDKLWLFPVKKPVDREVEAQTAPAPSKLTILKSVRPETIAGASAACLLLFLYGASFAVAATVNPFLSGRSFYIRADNLIGFAQMHPDMVNRAWDDIYEAKRIHPIDGNVNALQGNIRSHVARRHFGQADAAARQDAMAQANQLRELGFVWSKSALNDMQLALTEVRYHYLYRLQSVIYWMMADNSLDEERIEYDRKAMEALYQTVSMNPGDKESMFLLIRRLEGNAPKNRSEIIRLYQTLFHFHEAYFRERVYGRVLDSLAMAEYEDAYQRMQLVIDAIPDDPLFLMSWAQINIESGRLEAGRQVMARLQGLELQGDRLSNIARETSIFFEVQIAAALGNDQLVETLLEQETFDIVQPSQVQAVLYLAKERQGAPQEEVDVHRQRIVALGKSNPLHLQIAGAYAFKVYGNMEETIHWLEARRSADGPPMDFQGNVLLAKAYLQTGQEEKALALLPEIEGRGDTEYAQLLSRKIAQEIRTRAGASQ